MAWFSSIADAPKIRTSKQLSKTSFHADLGDGTWGRYTTAESVERHEVRALTETAAIGYADTLNLNYDSISAEAARASEAGGWKVRYSITDTYVIT